MSNSTTAIQFDDSIPQNTEGAQVLSVALTPLSATDILEIEATVFGACASGYISIALFKDSDANALAATGTGTGIVNLPDMLSISHFMTAGTTSAMTFKIRAGCSNGSTFTLNGASSGRIYGCSANSSMKVTELTP